MKNIILIAPSNAGKGTQAEITKEKYGMCHISAGDLLRQIANENTELGRRVKEFVDKGLLVTDELITEIIKDRISRSECKNGYILDGYPRTLKQLELYKNMLKEQNKDLGIVLLLECPYEICEQRVLGRLVCPKCKKIYHETNEEAKPKIEGRCDICNSVLEKRFKDSTNELRNKYDIYLKNTESLIKKFEKMGVLYKINASVGKNYTNEQVEKILKNFDKKEL